MADNSRHAAYLVLESTYGETPANPVFQPIRHNGATPGVTRTPLQSEEIRPDRQITDFRLGTVAVAGDFPCELSFGSFDDMLEAVLCGTWAPKAAKADATISVLASDDSFNTSGTFVGFQVGDLISTLGFTTPGNNGIFRVASVASNKLTVTTPEGANVVLVDEAAAGGHSVTTLETILKAGQVRRSFSILRHFTDIVATGEGKPYYLYKGVEFNTLNLTVNNSAIVMATFGTIGREGEAPSNTAPAGATFDDPTETAPLDSFTGECTIDGQPLAVMTEFNITLDNGLAARPVIGSKYTLRPSIGRSNLTGNSTIYFEDSAFVSRFSNEQDTAIKLEMPDGEGNMYVFEVPRFKFTQGQPDVSGSGPITLGMPFQGLMDQATKSNIIIRRIPAAPGV